MIKFLDLASQYKSIKLEIDETIHNVIADSAFIGGRYVQSFEDEFAQYVSAEYCVGVGNGTDGLEIAIQALDFPAGSEIIVPANSFIASSEAVSNCGHTVVFADVCPESYVISVTDVEKRITSKTAAIMAVHLYGHPCDMDGLLALSKRYGLKIIEDCAQAHGAQYKGQTVGSIGDIASFSFYPGKNLGAYGDGGAITTNDGELAKRCRMIANHGRVAKYSHEFEGRNSRLDGLQAAILSVKLKHLPDWTEKRIAAANRYIERLKCLSHIFLPVKQTWAQQVYHLFVVRTPARDQLKKYLLDHGVETGIHYPVALSKLQAYHHLNQSSEESFANQTDAYLLSLPIGEHITTREVDEVSALIIDFFADSNEAY